MSDWSPLTWSIIATAVFAVFGLAYLFIGWASRHSWRAVLRGLGLALCPIGLLIMGVMQLGVNGVHSLIAWANRTYMDTPMMIGIGVAGFGLLVFIIGSFISPVSAEDAKERRVAKATPPALQRGTAAPTPPPAASGAPAPTTAGGSDADPDDEIDAILRRHGIN